MIDKILDLLKILEDKNNKVRELFGTHEFDGIFDKEISLIWEILDKHFELKEYQTDFSAELYLKYGDGEISKEELKNELKKIN